jgi:hypothetical protein
MSILFQDNEEYLPYSFEQFDQEKEESIFEMEENKSDKNESIFLKLNNQNNNINKNIKDINLESLKIEKTTLEKTKLVENLFQPNIYINLNISEHIEPISEKKFLQKKRGRKSKSEKNNEENGEHNKYSNDNMQRKIKHLIIKNTQDLINYNISEKDFSSPKLLTLNQEQIFNSKVEFNKAFLQKTLKDIFSENISNRYHKPSDYNKTLIDNLINSGKEENKIFFKKLFDVKFIECLEHFRKSKEIEVLKGLTLFDDLINYKKDKNFEDKAYVNGIRQLLMNYETIIGQKKERNRKKNS